MDFEALKVKLSDKPMAFYAMCLGIVLGLVIIIFTAVSNSGRKSELQAQADANATKLVELRSELAGLSGGGGTTQLDPTEVSAARYSAKDLGTVVATRQTRYCNLAAGGRDEGYADKVTENANALDICFAEDSKNARTPWFSAADPTSSLFSWAFQTNYEFTSKNTECLWTCRDTDGLLVAFTIGTYDADANVFSDVKTYVTTYGQGTYMAGQAAPNEWVDVPDGSQSNDGNYGVDPDGNVVNENGEPYVTDDGQINPNDPDADWAAKFEELFKQSQEYRDQMQKGGGK